ncbi:hypothetical protein AB6A40_005203 [Gnathostoma spinigerum]|uniref:Uncharacterized protein n=1 Tax=Gnathostoma spinigerum TaxID=75299 RepID=A0ABD6EER7_9BILA
MLQLDRPSRQNIFDHQNVVYIISATAIFSHKLTTFMTNTCPANDGRTHHIFCVPEASIPLREHIKKEEKNHAKLTSIKDLPIRIYPLYSDLCTMFMEDTIPKLLIHNDWTELQKCASALRQIDMMSRFASNIRFKGSWAARVADILKKMRLQEEKGDVSHAVWNVSNIVIIDRFMDPITPFLTQLTYCGLVDELYSIGPSGNIRVPILDSENGKDSVIRDASLRDDLFLSLCDLHIKDVGKHVSEYVKTLRETRDTLSTSPRSNSLAEDKILVKKLIEMQRNERNATLHTSIAENVMKLFNSSDDFSDILRYEQEILRGDRGDRVLPFLEDMIIEAKQPSVILRLLALQSLCNGGLKPATLSSYQRLFVQSYGIYELSRLIKLQLTGLITSKQSKVKCTYPSFNFQSVNKQLTCLPDEDAPADLSSLAYPYNSYVPPLVRYIEKGIKSGWRDWATISSDNNVQLSDSDTIVLVVGGLTFGEVACLRRLKSLSQLILLTTSMVKAETILKSISEANI